jgi:hypothetical protein
VAQSRAPDKAKIVDLGRGLILAVWYRSVGYRKKVTHLEDLDGSSGEHNPECLGANRSQHLLVFERSGFFDQVTFIEYDVVKAIDSSVKESSGLD